MKLLKEIKWGAIIMAVSYIILGVILVIFPDTTARTLCYVGGAIAILIGMVNILGYFMRDVRETFVRNDIIIGLVQILIGLFIMVRADQVISLVPFILGIIVVISGFFKLQNGIDIKRMGYSNWFVFVFLACVNVIFGIILLVNPFTAVEILFMVIGIGLIYSGVTDLVTTFYLNSRAKKFMKETEVEGTAKIIDEPQENDHKQEFK